MVTMGPLVELTWNDPCSIVYRSDGRYSAAEIIIIMPAFKVWDGARSSKRSVMATGVQQLVEVGM